MGKKQFFLLVFLIAAIALLITWSMINRNSKNSEKNIPEVVSADNVLFTAHCGSCHLVPNPESLTKNAWQRVLVVMAIRMGLNDDEYERKISPEEKAIEDSFHLIPTQPLVSKADFLRIKNYILQRAPDSIKADVNRLKRDQPLKTFIRKDVTISGDKPSLITALKFQESTQKLWIGTMNNEAFNWSFKSGISKKIKLSSPPVDFTFQDAQVYCTAIGDLQPSELSRGSFEEISGQRIEPVLTHLHRPVYSVMKDFNNDGEQEVIVCNFGKNLGSLSLYFRNKKAGTFTEKVLLNQPGAIKCFIKDMDKDGKDDIVVLMAQADESVYILFNKGNLQFEAKRVLRFPPYYGTTDLVVEDYNHDGLPDIITAHGDNADYSILPKKEHGIRIHLNGGNNTFTESFFYPLYGVTRILASDFDKDGDIDFACNAFYAEYDSLGSEAFVYLENKNEKKFLFHPFADFNSIPVHALTMEKADIDGDGDDDILLGHFAFSPVPIPPRFAAQWQNMPTQLIIYQNTFFSPHQKIHH